MNKIFLIFSMLNMVFLFSQKPIISIYELKAPEESIFKKGIFDSYTYVPDPIEIPNRKIVYSDKKEFIISDRTKNGYVLSVYNTNNIQKTSTFNIDIPKVNNKIADWFKFQFYDNKTTTFYSKFNKSQKTNTLYAKIIDRENNVLVEEKILSENKATSVDLSGKDVIVNSKDRSKFLLVKERLSNRNTKEQLEFIVFDNHLNKLYEKEVIIPYPSKSIRVKDVLLTNNGEIILITYWSSTFAERKEMPGFENTYKIFKVSKEDDKIQEISLMGKDKILYYCNGFVSNDSLNELSIVGFHRDVSNINRASYGINGIFHYKIDVTNWKTKSSNFNLIDDKTLTKILVENEHSNRSINIAESKVEMGQGFMYIEIRSIFYNNSGEMIVVCDYNTPCHVCYNVYNSLTQSHNTIYNANKIVSFSISKEGELKSSSIIQLKQCGFTSSSHFGIIPMFASDIFFYIFNEGISTFDSPNQYSEELIKYLKGNKISIASIDQNDKIEKMALFDYWKQDMIIFPQNYASINNNQTIILWGNINNSKDNVLLKISIE